MIVFLSGHLDIWYVLTTAMGDACVHNWMGDRLVTVRCCIHSWGSENHVNQMARLTDLELDVK